MLSQILKLVTNFMTKQIFLSFPRNVYTFFISQLVISQHQRYSFQELINYGVPHNDN